MTISDFSVEGTASVKDEMGGALDIIVEDAAKSAFVKAQSVYRADHDHFPLKATWETTSESVREGWREIAYAALEAAYMPPLGTQPEPRQPRDVRSALAAAPSRDQVTMGALREIEAGPVPVDECPFAIGQPVHMASPYAEEDPNAVFYVTGVTWEHRMVPHRGWNITIASRDDIEKGYGQTDGFGPSDLRSALSSLSHPSSLVPTAEQGDAEMDKIDAAIKSAGLMLDPVADGGGAWHYVLRSLTPPIAGAGEEHRLATALAACSAAYKSIKRFPGSVHDAAMAKLVKALGNDPDGLYVDPEISQLYSCIGAAIDRLWPNKLGPQSLEELVAFIEEERRCDAEYLGTVKAKLAEARDVIEPFSIIAGEYFAQNLNRDDIVASIKRPDGTRLDITAGHLFDARSFHSPKEPGPDGGGA